MPKQSLTSRAGLVCPAALASEHAKRLDSGARRPEPDLALA